MRERTYAWLRFALARERKASAVVVLDVLLHVFQEAGEVVQPAHLRLIPVITIKPHWGLPNHNNTQYTDLPL